MRRLEGRVAVVTGGGSGIGQAAALAFAHDGAAVVVADIDAAGGERTAGQIVAAGGTAIFVRTDVSNARDAEAMIEAAVRAFGRLDCAFNNAGVMEASGAAAADCTEEAWHRVLAVNLTGVWLCMKFEIRQMLRQAQGAIVNMASAAGLVGLPNAAYTASKHGVVGLTRSAALSYAAAGIRVNAVCPGYVRTPLLEPVLDADPGAAARLARVHPIGRMAAPEEIVEAVAWLCSDGASFVTGHALAVDGGLTAQ